MEKGTKIIILIILLALALVILPTSSYFIAKLNLLLKGDVSISIDPSEKSLLVNTGKTEDIPFTVSIDNSDYCKAACKYEFINLGKNETLDTDLFTGKKGTQLKKTYTILSPKKGTGQLAYKFTVSCKNTRSFLCPVESSERVRSAFVTLSYELSLEEKQFKEDVKISLLSLLDNLSSLDIAAQELLGRIEMIDSYIPMQDILSEAIKFSEKTYPLINRSEVLKAKWANEDYEDLYTDIRSYDSYIAELLHEKDQISNSAELRLNYTLDTANRIKDFKEYINQIDDINKGYYLLSINKTNLENETAIGYSLLVSKFNARTYDSETELSSDMFFMRKKIDAEYKLIESATIKEASAGAAIVENDTNMTHPYPTPKNLTDSISLITKLCGIINYTQTNITNTSSADPANSTNTTNTTYIAYSSAFSADAILFKQKHCDMPNTTIASLIRNATLNLPPENITIVAVSRITKDLVEHKEICCIFGKCEECCASASAVVDGASASCSQSLTPIILVHGHAFSKDSSVEYSLSGFNQIRNNLEGDGFIDIGTILPSQDFVEREKGIFGRFGKPVVAGTTYYIDAYDTQGKLINPPQKSETIETYAKRLNKTIELLKYKTGTDKVNIIAYSMGGLVARKYLVDFGEESVSKLIMIDTPNKGIAGKVESFCPIAGEKLECQEMSSTSQFINELNNPGNDLKTVKVYEIVGTGCDMDGKDGDGIVLSENQRLSYALNFDIAGDCIDATLHEQMLDIAKRPKIYETIQSALKN